MDKRRADARYPSDDELVALMAEHQSFGKVAQAVGVRRESLRDFLKIRQDLDARMREHQRPKLSREEAEERDRASSRRYAARMRAERPEEIRKRRRDHMRSYGPEYRQRWNHYNRLRRKALALPTPEADEYALMLRQDPCSYCGASCEHIDHIIAIARGGDGDYANLTAACAACNHRKHVRSVLHFMLERTAA